MSKREPLDPRTLRAVARWHEEQAESAEARKADQEANGNYLDSSREDGCGEAHRYTARKLRDDAAHEARAIKRKGKAK